MNNSIREKRRQLTRFKVLLLIALGLAIMVTSIVYIVRDNKKEKKLLNKDYIIEKNS